MILGSDIAAVAHGSISQGRLIPANYVANFAWDDEIEDVKMQFRDGAVSELEVKPTIRPGGDRPADHHADTDRHHRQRIGRPVRDREQHEPEAGDPSRQRGTLTVAKQEFPAPGKSLGDIEVHVLRRPQTCQDHGPKHHVENDEARHQPRAQFLVARPGDEARGAAAVPVGNSIVLATDIESGDAPALCQRSVA